MTDRIKVLIVDDHQVVRQGLRTFLELQDDLLLVGEAANGLEAVEMTRRLQPDIVLMDLVMPVVDGVTATHQITELGLAVKVIALTSFSDDDQVFPAIQAGAASYLLKDVTPDALVDTIRAVHRGENRLHPDITRKLMRQVAEKPGPMGNPAVESLTGREQEVLALVARGFSNQKIAETLVISEKTVKSHVSSLLGKLGLGDRTQLAIYAFKSGLARAD